MNQAPFLNAASFCHVHNSPSSFNHLILTVLMCVLHAYWICPHELLWSLFTQHCVFLLALLFHSHMVFSLCMFLYAYFLKHVSFIYVPCPYYFIVTSSLSLQVPMYFTIQLSCCLYKYMLLQCWRHPKLHFFVAIYALSQGNWTELESGVSVTFGLWLDQPVMDYCLALYVHLLKWKASCDLSGHRGTE